MGGLTVAMALGLPAGTLIGAAEWRVTLWVVAGVGLVAAIAVALFVPVVSLPSDTLRARLRPLRRPEVLAVLAVTTLALAGTHVVYTYIGPVLHSATGGSVTALTGVLLAWGLGNVVGNAAAGYLADRFEPRRVALGGLAAAALVLVAGPLATGDSLPVAIGWAAVWGVCVSLPVVPQQHRLIATEPSASAVLLGLNSSAIYLGVALGGGLGGLAQPALAPALLGLVGAALSGLGVLLTLVAGRGGMNSGKGDQFTPKVCAASNGEPP
jgi:predicted MFS family arabinose efflux permease